VDVFPNGEWNVPPVKVLLNNFICTNNDDLTNLICDRMEIQQCALYTAWATRITSCADLSPGDSVFAVPDKRMFIFPTRGVSTMMDISHLGQPSTGPIVLETLSEYPRIFRLHNFFTDYEADTLMADAIEEFQTNPPPSKKNSYHLSETEDELSIDADEFVSSSHRGHDHPLEPMTGDRIDLGSHAVLLKSDVAFRLRRRVLDLLGVFPYDDTYSEGWQILRYNESQGYDIHQDWIEPSFLASHDYNSAYEGTNRFVAIYFYLQTPIEGGETVFPLLDPTPQQIREQYFKNEVVRFRDIARKMKQEYKDKEEKESELSKLMRSASAVHGGLTDLSGYTKRTVCRARHGEESGSQVKDSNKGNQKSKNKSKKKSGKRSSAFEDLAVLEDANEDKICEEIFVDNTTGEIVDDLKERRDKENSDKRESDASFRATITDPMLRRAYDDLDHIPYFPSDSWEHSLQDQCLKRFTVRPQRLEALIFYVQKPNGLPDTQALHASCPVIQGQKYLAAMWVWNGPKAGSWTRNVNTGRYEKPNVLAVSASFEVLDLMYAKLYWEDQVWDELWPGRPVKVNTFAGQTWKIMIGEDIVASWVMNSDQPRQRYILKSEDIPTRVVNYLAP
jgi:hypothetical protein